MYVVLQGVTTAAIAYECEQGQTPSVCSRHVFLGRGNQEVREDTVFQNPSGFCVCEGRHNRHRYTLALGGP